MAIKDGNGRTALHFAASAGSSSVVGWILKEHSTPEIMDACDDSGMTPLALALITGHTAIAESLMAAACDVNKPAKDGVTALHRAAGHGDSKAVQLLLQHGADLTCATTAGTYAK